MYRACYLFAWVLALLSLSGCRAEPKLSTADLVDTVYRSASREESVRIHSETELFHVKDDIALRGRYTLVDGTRLKAEFEVRGETVSRTFTLGKRGLTTSDGMLLVRGPKGDIDSHIERYRRDTDSFIARENVYTKVSMRTLGAYLGDHCAGKELVVIMRVGDGSDAAVERDTMLLDALNAGIDGRLTVISAKVGELVNREEADGTILGPQVTIQAKEFDDVMAEHKDVQVFLSLAGLPDDFTKMHVWTMNDEERPNLALANVDVSLLRPAIQQGKVAVVLHLNPEAVYDPKGPSSKDPKKAFDERYILIDAANVDALAAKYPDLFAPESEGR